MCHCKVVPSSGIKCCYTKVISLLLSDCKVTRRTTLRQCSCIATTVNVNQDRQLCLISISYAVKSLASLQQELLSHCSVQYDQTDSGALMFSSFLPIAAQDNPDINLSGVDSTPLGTGK